MKNLLIASPTSPAGKTAVAAALGSLLAGEGLPICLLRLRPEGKADPHAEADARALAGVAGCTSPSRAVTAVEAEAEVREAAKGGGIAVVEAPAGDAKLASRLSARVVLCAAGAPEEQIGELQRLAQSLGEAVLGVVATAVPRGRLHQAAGAIIEAGLPCLAVLPEDSLLAGPTVAEVASALGAKLLTGDGRQDEVLERLMIGSIAADPAMPYFSQHGRKAVITRFDKTDLLLAALLTDVDCLILTGGQPPSPYVMDRVENAGLEVSVLVAPQDTVSAVGLLDELYGHTRFAGEQKLERMVELTREALDLERLGRALA